jgi:hypothetical protein
MALALLMPSEKLSFRECYIPEAQLPRREILGSWVNRNNRPLALSNRTGAIKSFDSMGRSVPLCDRGEA